MYVSKSPIGIIFNRWDSACQVNSTQFSPSTNLVVLRQQLQRGLATVRVDTNHGLDVQLVVRMAQTFAERVTDNFTLT